MAYIETWAIRLFLIVAGIALPVCVFFPNTPNISFAALGLISLLLLVTRNELKNLLPPLRAIAPFIVLTVWALIACLWSDTPERSLQNVGKIVLAILAWTSFYGAHTSKIDQPFMQWFIIGYYAALFLLILDEILNSHILRTLRGAQMDLPEYYHSVTLLVFSLWPIMIYLKDRHAAVKTLIIAFLTLGVFEMTDHAAKLALITGLLAWGVTYLNPRIFLRIGAVLSAVIMLGFPFALKNMDPVEVIHKNEFIMFKPSYQHRMFILKRATNMIFEQPWFGHGLDVYRGTIDKKRDVLVEKELEKIVKSEIGTPYSLEVMSQTTHPHNLSLQVWLELGFVGALIYALFLLSSLWRLSSLPDRRYELSAFMGLYTAVFTIAHISFGAWQMWWLLSVGTILSLILWQVITRKA